MKKIINLLKITFVISALLLYSSCTTNNLEGTTEQNKTMEEAITKVDNIYSFLKGGLNDLTSSSYYGRDFIINSEVRSGNCFPNGNSGRFGTTGAMVYNSSNFGFCWSTAYSAISICNLIISTDISKLEGDLEYAKNLQGQAYALRALCHYDLLTVYGQQNAGGTLGVPYVTKSIKQDSPEEDFMPSRKTVDEVKSLVYKDLAKAYEMIKAAGEDYDDFRNSIFISSWAVKAIEAKVALYFGEWQKAYDAANAIVQSGDYAIVKKGDFLKSWKMKLNENSIFELPFSPTDSRGINGLAYIYRDQWGYGDISVVPAAASIFTDGDIRKEILAVESYGWGDYLVNKVKYPDTDNGADNVPVIRYEEMVLTAAEAALELGNDADALSLLNSLAKERGVEEYTAATKDDILLERRKEFMFEGLYFHDLMRTKQPAQKSFDDSSLEEVPWGDYKLACPIPQKEIDANSNMVQNKGY